MPVLPSKTKLKDMVALVERLRAWTEVNLYTYTYICVCVCVPPAWPGAYPWQYVY
jgi:hypothetical protein